MSLPKNCEVCDGLVISFSRDSVFGHCDKCGLVYLLFDKRKEKEALEGLNYFFGEKESKSTS